MIRRLLHVCTCSSCRNPSTHSSPPMPTSDHAPPNSGTPIAIVTRSGLTPSAAGHDRESSSVVDQHLCRWSKPDDLTAEALDKLINHLQSRISHLRSAAGSAARDSSAQGWEGYTSNVTAFLQGLGKKSQTKSEMAGEGARAVKDTVLPLLVETLGAVGSLHWTAFGFSMVAWGIDRLQKHHENFEDCVDLLQNTVFLLKHTKSMWVHQEPIATDDLVLSNLHGIAEVAFKVSVICASCGQRDDTSTIQGYVHNYIRMFLEAASLGESIRRLKEQIRDLLLRTVAIGMHETPTPNSNSILTRQLSKFRTVERDDLAGRAEQAERVEAILGVESEEMIAVCIHGMGGVGKSTLALRVYNNLLSSTQKRITCSRIELPLDPVATEKELPRLQKKIITDISKKPNSKAAEAKIHSEATVAISDALEGKERLQRAFEKSGGPILLYIDNVQQQDHLLDLLPNVQHFPRGSRLLVTTRNERISACMSMLGVDDDRCHSIPVENLGIEDSRALLRKSALSKIKNADIIDSNQTLKDLEEQVLDLCDGLPLALKLMGSYIAQSKKGAESADTWKHVVESMKEGRPVDGEKNNKLYAQLRFSIDALDDVLRRDLFDLVACGYFQGWYNYRVETEAILGADEMQSLIDRHILEYADDEDEVVCHDVIQSLVRHMDMATDDHELRVIDGEDLDDAMDLGRIVCLAGVTIRDVRRLSRMKRLRFAVGVGINVCEASTGAASIDVDLPHLRVLDIGEAAVEDGLHVDDGQGPVVKLRRCPELRVLRVFDDVVTWQAPFVARKLQSLDIVNRKQEIDFGSFQSACIRQVYLENCQALTTFPPVSTDTRSTTDALDDLFGSLQSVWIHYCESLEQIPETLRKLSQLTSLAVNWCANLTSLPESIGQLTNLSELYLRHCWRLEMLPESISLLTSLKVLNLEGCTSLQRIPVGITQFTNLETLNLQACTSLGMLPDGMFQNLASSLWSLDLRYCRSLETLPEGISALTLLTGLSLEKCASLQSIPEGMGHVVWNLRGCASLRRIPRAMFVANSRKITTLNLSSCESLETLPKEISLLTSLTDLRLECCRSLQCIPEGIGELASLKKLNLRRCSGLQELPDGMFRNLASSLVELDLSFCDRLERLPDGISRLTSLTDLRLECCGSLRCIPWGGIELQLRSLRNLNVQGCSSLDGLPHGAFQNLAGPLAMRERKVSKNRNLLNRLLYMVSM